MGHSSDVDWWYALAGFASCAYNVPNFFLFKEDADLRIECFSCKQRLHTLSPGANAFTFLAISYLMLKSIFLLFLCPNVITKCCCSFLVFLFER